MFTSTSLANKTIEPYSLGLDSPGKIQKYISKATTNAVKDHKCFKTWNKNNVRLIKC